MRDYLVVLGAHVSFIRVPGFEPGRAICAPVGLFAGVPSKVFPEVVGVTELASAKAATEPGLLVVNHHVIVEAVLTGEGSIA